MLQKQCQENRTENGYSCDMCAFEQDENACFSAPECWDILRNDHRTIIFVEAGNKE